jgi:hypothetical protein
MRGADTLDDYVLCSRLHIDVVNPKRTKLIERARQIVTDPNTRRVHMRLSCDVLSHGDLGFILKVVTIYAIGAAGLTKFIKP